MHRGTLRNNARRLLGQLITRTEVRLNDSPVWKVMLTAMQADPRPIIFVCHSLGGIVAKQVGRFGYQHHAMN